MKLVKLAYLNVETGEVRLRYLKPTLANQKLQDGVYGRYMVSVQLITVGQDAREIEHEL